MTYDIYFHNDFDGRASAAIVLRFLRDRGDDIEHFTPVDFDLEKQWLKNDFFKKHTLFSGPRNPAIVVDFLYHPGAAMWFDHHPTSIKRADWKKKFKRNKNFNWDSSYPSSSHWTYVALKKNFGWKPPKHFGELVKWLDVVDGARYKSAKQAIEMKEPALQIEGFVEKTVHDRRIDVWFINALEQKTFAQIAKEPYVKKEVAAYRRDTEKSLAFYKKNLKLFGKVGFIDLTQTTLKRSLYAPFYFYPSIRYGMRYTRKDKWLHISAGENPWRPTGKVAIGKLMQKYGGGGHQTVGGVEFYEGAKAQKAITEIIGLLNTEG